MDKIYSRVANSLNTKLKELFGEQQGFSKEDLEKSVIPVIKRYHLQYNLMIWDINILGVMDDPMQSGGIYYTITAQQTLSDEEKETHPKHIRNICLLDLVNQLGTKHKISNININDITPDVVQVTFKLTKDFTLNY